MIAANSNAAGGAPADRPEGRPEDAGVGSRDRPGGRGAAVQWNDLLSHVLDRLRREDRGAIAVCHGGRPIGMVRRDDIERLLGSGSWLDSVQALDVMRPAVEAYPERAAALPDARRVADVMRRPAPTIQVHAPVRAATEALRREGTSSLTVLEGDRIAGMLTARDIAVRSRPGHDRSCRVGAIMSAGVVICGDDQPLEEARRLMEAHDVGRLPVVDAEGRLVGLVSARRLMGHMEAERPRKVTFRRPIPDSTGHDHYVAVACVHVRPGLAEDAALALAAERVKSEHGLADWRRLAEDYTILESE